MYMLVREFSLWLRWNKGYSKSTVDNYCRTLVIFDDFLRMSTRGEGSINLPHTIRLIDIDDFTTYLDKKGKNVKTINNYLYWIKSFLKFCKHKGLYVLDYELISFSREPETKITALDWDKMKQLLIFMKNDPSKSEILRIRDYAMALMLVYTGLRVSELINLRVEDIQENIQVIGKWGRRRGVSLDPEYVKVVKLYLFLRKNIKSDFVFVSHSPNSYWSRISRNSVESIIKTAGEKAGVGKVRPHRLRHTCATQMLENGGNIVYISQILGHKNLRTTQGYLDYSNNKLRETQNLIPRVE